MISIPSQRRIIVNPELSKIATGLLALADRYNFRCIPIAIPDGVMIMIGLTYPEKEISASCQIQAAFFESGRASVLQIITDPKQVPPIRTFRAGDRGAGRLLSDMRVDDVGTMSWSDALVALRRAGCLATERSQVGNCENDFGNLIQTFAATSSAA
jgi:hypothetical protein